MVKVILAAVGILILLITSASHPVHETLLSDTKYKVFPSSVIEAAPSKKVVFIELSSILFGVDHFCLEDNSTVNKSELLV